MNERISITNKTMELADCKKNWFFDEKYKSWCLEDILYTDQAVMPKFQRLSIFVPEPYMKEQGDIQKDGTMNGYTSKTAPVIFENNSAGYMQMPHVWLDGPRCMAQQYLDKGYVFVTCGNRGSESKNKEGQLCGKSPANLVDLKTAIRFLRHNCQHIPGDFGRMISVGSSAGGDMSSLLGITGNNEDYDSYLKENGAFMEEQDNIFASMIYCPIIDLEHADMAYEWMFFADKENETSFAGPKGVMSPFQEALSEKLKKRYISYFNQLELRDPLTQQPLTIGEDGRSGSGYVYLINKLNKSAEKFLQKLRNHELKENYLPKDYLNGNYVYKTVGPIRIDAKEEIPSLGDMVSRPPQGFAYQGFETPMITVKGKDKKEWLSWDGTKAQITDLDAYIKNHRRRMKPCTAFDSLNMNSGENRVFGTNEKPYMHFNSEIASAILELKAAFPKEYQMYYDSYAKVLGDKELEHRVHLYNPFHYIGTEKSDMAKCYRIRVGASDADTSLTMSMTLALKLAAAGKEVDYEIVWEEPHCQADYQGEVCTWIEKICRQTKVM